MQSKGVMLGKLLAYHEHSISQQKLVIPLLKTKEYLKSINSMSFASTRHYQDENIIYV